MEQIRLAARSRSIRAVPSHPQVEAYLTYRAGDRDVEGYVRNLAQSAFITVLNNATAFYSAPRTYGVRISRRF